MIGTLRILLAAALLGVPLVLSGCSLNGLRVVIPDFESNEVLGVNVYQRVSDTGDPAVDWQRASQIAFQEPYVSDSGAELMEYSVDGTSEDFDFVTAVHRSSAGADQVVVELLFDYAERAGEVRVTTYNSMGESPPSQNTVFL